MDLEYNQALISKLNAGLAKLNLALPQDAREKLLLHLSLLAKWNKTYNLTAITNLDAMVTLHLLDSLAIAQLIQGPNILDVGSGAGFPGIPLAIALPQYNFVLLDSNRKKTTFLTNVVAQLKLTNVKVIHERVENFHFAQGFDTIVTRATFSLSDFVTLTKHLLHPKGYLLAMKGQYPTEELQLVDADVNVEKLHVPGLDAERHVVKIQLRIKN